MIRRRKNSFQAVLSAGTDPLTGRKVHLRGSSTDEAEANRILKKLVAQVNEQRHANRASLQTTVEALLNTHELAESTRETYAEHARNHVFPVLGPESLGRITPHVLERFHVELPR